MTADHRRSERVAEAIREEVASFLNEGAKDPRLVAMVTVTGVETTRDLRHAKIFISMLGSDEDKRSTIEGLNSLAGHLRSRLGRSLRLRVAPEIAFRYDESVERASRIESLLAQVRQDLPPADPPSERADDDQRTD
jgi:ribosome-binding factor A